MANRMIRDGILESEAVLSLPTEARWLYVSILLSADDVGLFEATPFRLARRADIRREHAERLVQLLVDVDLIRLYRHDGKDYGFIPRFGQRLQIKRARCPIPSLALLNGDDDAINKIKHLTSDPTVDHRESRKSTAVQPPEPEPEPEVKQIPSVAVAPGVPPSSKKKTAEGFDRLWAIYPRKMGKGPAEKCFAKLNPDRELLARLLLAVEEQSRCEQWRKDGGQFIPYLATWLNQKRWEDVIETGSRTGGGSIFDGAL